MGGWRREMQSTVKEISGPDRGRSIGPQYVPKQTFSYGQASCVGMPLNLVHIITLAVFCFLSINAASFVEPRSGHAYAEKTDDGVLNCFGCGIREKKIGPAKVKVYSVAAYFSQNDLIKKMKAAGIYKKTSPKVMSASLRRILSNGVEGEICLTMARDVGPEKMASALSEAVEPRMRGKDLNSLGILKESIIEGGAQKSSKLSFRVNIKGKKLGPASKATGKMIFKVNDKVMADIDSKALCSAFVEVYLDKNAVSSELKSAVCEYVAKL